MLSHQPLHRVRHRRSDRKPLVRRRPHDAKGTPDRSRPARRNRQEVHDEPWEETRRFVDEFNARRIAAGEDAVALNVWLTRGRPDSAEDVA
jgi:hypothetical protein